MLLVSPRIYKTSITRFLALTKAQINKTTSNYTKGVLLQNLIGFVIISCPLVLSNWIPPLLTVPRSLLSRLHSAQSSLIHSGGATLLELRLALQPKLMEGDRVSHLLMAISVLIFPIVVGSCFCNSEEHSKETLPSFSLL